MSERGVFAVDRGIWSDPDFPNEPFSEREAFLWLVSEAAWRPTKVRVGSKLIELERGQCSFSTRFMAAKFQWSEARVRRFLQRRSDMNQLRTKTDAGATQVTICKYDAFQRVGTLSDAGATQERRTSDAKKKQGNTTSNEVEKTDERVTVLCEVLDEDHATAINHHRKLKGAKTWTPHAARLMVKELIKARDAGIEPNEASEAIIRNSWTGFEAEWLLKNRRSALRVVGGQQGPPKQSGAALMEETARELWAERFGPSDQQPWSQERVVDGYAHRR